MTGIEEILWEECGKLKSHYYHLLQIQNLNRTLVVFEALANGGSAFELEPIGVPVLVSLLNKNFSTKKRRSNITASDLVRA